MLGIKSQLRTVHPIQSRAGQGKDWAGQNRAGQGRRGTSCSRQGDDEEGPFGAECRKMALELRTSIGSLPIILRHESHKRASEP